MSLKGKTSMFDDYSMGVMLNIEWTSDNDQCTIIMCHHRMMVLNRHLLLVPVNLEFYGYLCK